MEWSTSIVLDTPGTDITFANTGSGDEYLLDPTQCHGLDGAPLRVPVDDRPQTDGGIVFDGHKGPRHIFIAGLLLCRTGTVVARNTMEDNLRTALEDILAADGSLTWTPSGGSSRTLEVRCEIPLETTGGWLKQFSFGLVAADPDF